MSDDRPDEVEFNVSDLERRKRRQGGGAAGGAGNGDEPPQAPGAAGPAPDEPERGAGTALASPPEDLGRGERRMTAQVQEEEEATLQSLNFQHYLEVLRRRWIVVIGIAAAVAGFSVVMANMQPDVWAATAVAERKHDVTARTRIRNSDLSNVDLITLETLSDRLNYKPAWERIKGVMDGHLDIHRKLLVRSAEDGTAELAPLPADALGHVAWVVRRGPRPSDVSRRYQQMSAAREVENVTRREQGLDPLPDLDPVTDLARAYWSLLRSAEVDEGLLDHPHTEAVAPSDADGEPRLDGLRRLLLLLPEERRILGLYDEHWLGPQMELVGSLTRPDDVSGDRPSEVEIVRAMPPGRIGGLLRKSTDRMDNFLYLTAEGSFPEGDHIPGADRRLTAFTANSILDGFILEEIDNTRESGSQVADFWTRELRQAKAELLSLKTRVRQLRAGVGESSVDPAIAGSYSILEKEYVEVQRTIRALQQQLQVAQLERAELMDAFASQPADPELQAALRGVRRELAEVRGRRPPPTDEHWAVRPLLERERELERRLTLARLARQHSLLEDSIGELSAERGADDPPGEVEALRRRQLTEVLRATWEVLHPDAEIPEEGLTADQRAEAAALLESRDPTGQASPQTLSLLSRRAELRAMEVGARRRLEVLREELVDLRDQIGRLGGTNQDLLEAELEVQFLQDHIEELTIKRQEALLQEGLDLSSFRVTSRSTGGGRVGPNRVNNYLLGALVGTFLGVLTAFFLEYQDNTIKSPADLRRLTGLEYLGHVYWWDAEREGILIDHENPKSAISEVYRVIHNNLRYAGTRTPERLLMVASAVQGEGKSVTAVNLAISYALEGNRVVLVDCDLRRPQGHRLIEITEGHDRVGNGVTDYLLGQAPIDDVVFSTPIADLHLLPSGRKVRNPARLLRSARVDDMFDDLGERFDVVIVDGPAVLPVVDATLVSNRVRGVVVVVEAGATKIPLVREAVDRLRHVQSPILGAVLNKVRSTRSGYYGYYGQVGYGYEDERLDPDEIRFGAIALREHHVTQRELQQALTLQEQRREQGREVPSLGQVLVDLGIMSDEDVESVLRIQEQLQAYQPAHEEGDGPRDPRDPMPPPPEPLADDADDDDDGDDDDGDRPGGPSFLRGPEE